MSTSVIVGTVGAVVGFVIGGPQGAYWGWTLGSFAGNAADPQVIRGPSLGELSAQTSQEGVPIPIIYGMSPPIAGHVLSTSKPRIEIRKKKTDPLGIGPKIRTEHVFRTYAIGICEGPVEVLRVWRNGKLRFDARNPGFTSGGSFTTMGGGTFYRPSRNELFIFGSYHNGEPSGPQRVFFVEGNYTQNALPQLEAIHGAGTTPAYRGMAYMAVMDEELTDLAGVIPHWTFQVIRRAPGVETDAYPLQTLVTDLCGRAGLPEEKVDVSLLPGVGVAGLTVTNQYTVSQAIEALGQVYKFDVAKYDGKVRCIPRGGDVVATITEDDMVEDEKDIDESRRFAALQIPRVVHLSYHDVDSEALLSSKQSSERSGEFPAAAELSLESAVVMDADLAAQTAAVWHNVMIEEQKGELRFSLSDKFLRLTPADPIIAQYNGKSERVRIQQADIQDGKQDYICLRDRQSAYTSVVAGIPPPPLRPVTEPDAGVTLVEALDVPLLRDSHDGFGVSLYIAVGGLSEEWRGADVDVRLQGSPTPFEQVELRTNAVMGGLITALPDHPAEYPDLTNAFTVRLETPGDLLETDLAGMLNRTNLAAIGTTEDGWELVNFANAEQDSGGDWTISHLLRGRKHTATRFWPEGTRFVLLNLNLVHLLPMEITHLGRAVTVSAATMEQATSKFPFPSSNATTSTSLTFASQTQREYAVAYLQAVRDGDMISISWQGVGRLGAGTSARHSRNFIGYRVRITDGSLSQQQNVVVQGLVANVSGYGSPLTVEVSQVNRLTGEGPIVQIDA